MSDVNPEAAHFNARVRGMKSSLLPQQQVEDLLDKGDVQSVIDVLTDTTYHADMAEALVRYAGADAVEEAVSRNLIATYQQLLRRAQGDFRRYVELFLARWDLLAAKSLLRAKHHNIDPKEAASALIPGPTISLAQLDDLATRDGMEDLMRGLVVWNRELCGGLRGLLETYESNRDLSVLEEALDRAYFVTALGALGDAEEGEVAVLREYLQAEVDRINLRRIFDRFHAQVSEPIDKDAFLPGGSLAPSTLKRVAESGDPAAAMEVLASTRYREAAEDVFQFLQTGRFAPVERHLDRVVMQHIRRAARRDVFGLPVLIDFVWQKINEVVNLRLIARGIAGNLPVGRVREELYFI